MKARPKKKAKAKRLATPSVFANLVRSECGLVRSECGCCKGHGVLPCKFSCASIGKGAHMHVCDTCSGDGHVLRYDQKAASK